MTPAAALAMAGQDALLVGRPRRLVAHVYVGPVTPSGRFAAAGGRTACRAHTRRLSVLTGRTRVPGGTARCARRVCVRCSVCLKSTSRQAELTPTTRDGWLAAYGSLTVAQLTAAAALVSTVAESHYVGYLAQLLHPQARDLHALINTDRHRLTAAERTPDEVAAIAVKRAAEVDRDARIVKARRDDVRRQRAQDRANRGLYVAPGERPA